MTTTSLQNKIERMRRQAPQELQKARLCTDVVEAFIDGSPALDRVLSALKTEVASNWSVVTAFQFMSGRQAELCAQLEDGPAKARMLMVHRVAGALARSGALTRLDLTAVRAIAVTASAEASKEHHP